MGQLGHRMADAIGIVLISACDLRVVAEEMVFSIPELDLGIPLAWGGIPRLVREIGPALTKELVMTCRRFTPLEAKAIGFVIVSANYPNHLFCIVVPPSDFRSFENF